MGLFFVDANVSPKMEYNIFLASFSSFFFALSISFVQISSDCWVVVFGVCGGDGGGDGVGDGGGDYGGDGGGLQEGCGGDCCPRASAFSLQSGVGTTSGETVPGFVRIKTFVNRKLFVGSNLLILS